jgi:hypothetical protein
LGIRKVACDIDWNHCHWNADISSEPCTYRLVRKYMPQHHPLGSGIRLSS